MILLALLVGSDYTIGIQGIGPVTALEVLAAFPYSKSTEIHMSHNQLLSGLAEFRKWLIGEKTPGPGRTSLKNKLKNVVLSDSFPSRQVVQAYLEPTVETSKEAFTWANPDVVGLTDFARTKFGWSNAKSEEILKPVLKRLHERNVQTSIKDYFQTTFKKPSEATKQMSKRVKQAIDKIGNPHVSSEEENNKTETKNKPKRKYKTSKGSADPSGSEKKATKRKPSRKQDKQDDSSDEDIKVLKQTRMMSKNKLDDIKKEIKSKLEEKTRTERVAPNPHKRDVILQKEKDKAQSLKAKLKAIEVFRKSKKGPGFTKKKAKIVRKLKEDADLSESSSD